MGSNDASDFHDSLGSITWEKRDTSNNNMLRDANKNATSTPVPRSIRIVTLWPLTNP